MRAKFSMRRVREGRKADASCADTYVRNTGRLDAAEDTLARLRYGRSRNLNRLRFGVFGYEERVGGESAVYDASGPGGYAGNSAHAKN